MSELESPPVRVKSTRGAYRYANSCNESLKVFTPNGGVFLFVPVGYADNEARIVPLPSLELATFTRHKDHNKGS